MASYDGNIVGQLREHTECPICVTTFTDPRILPCLHTFCLKCLENTASSRNKRPGYEMLCPTCRSVFTVPSNGFMGLKINFNMNTLITMANDAILKLTTTSFCDRHKTKPLDGYCLECEQPVCFSCLIDNHQGHKATDIVEVKDRFSKELGDYLRQISSYKEHSLHLMKEEDEKKRRYLYEIMENENAILKRSKELIDRIERDTKSLLEELSSLKAQRLAEMEKETKELEKQCAVVERYKTIYEATMANVSLADMCCVKKELPIIVEKLDDWFKTRKISSFEILLQLQDKIEIDLKSEINNIVGRIKSFKITWKADSEFMPLKEKKVFVVGSDGCRGLTNEMFEFNLSRPNEFSEFKPVPAEMQITAVPVSFGDKLFLIGMGEYCNEIWKFERISGWTKCANLDQAREGHCVSVVDTLIYICGGYNPNSSDYLNVEVYDLKTNECSIVGELVHNVSYSTSVAYKGLIYIFGGCLEVYDEETVCETYGQSDCVQIFNCKDNVSSLLSKPMPSPQSELLPLTWNNSVILLHEKTCFIFDFETEIWREMEQFKTDVACFGLVYDDKKVYVFGGRKEEEKGCRDEIKCVRVDDIVTCKNVEWKFHGRLPKKIDIHIYA